MGNLTDAWDQVETDSFTYDELDRPVERTIEGVGTLYYAYDLAGRRTMVQDWTGSATYYDYDKRGLITRVHSSAGWTYYTFDARGAVTKRELPNGTHTYYVYDAAGRTSSIHDEQSDGTAICSFDFTRDANGNILTSLREDDSCWYYAYDGLQRLTEAEWKDSTGVSLYAFEYDYDKVGNRTHLLFNGVHTYYTYNEANELTVEEELGGDTAYYTYDGRGNQVTRETLGGDTLYFDYNSRNLITRIDSTEGGFTPNTFDYNALGQRIRITDSGGTTYYVWDGLNITHEHDGSGTITRRYTHGHTPVHGVFSLIDVEDDQGDHFFYHLDQVGGVHRLTDASETTDTIYEFSPYGRMLQETGNAPNLFAFPGTYLALPDVSGLGLSPTRHYDSQTGRLPSRDADRRTPEYHALANNPVGNLDPSGRAGRKGSPTGVPRRPIAVDELSPAPEEPGERPKQPEGVLGYTSPWEVSPPSYECQPVCFGDTLVVSGKWIVKVTSEYFKRWTMNPDDMEQFDRYEREAAGITGKINELIEVEKLVGWKIIKRENDRVVTPEELYRSTIAHETARLNVWQTLKLNGANLLRDIKARYDGVYMPTPCCSTLVEFLKARDQAMIARAWLWQATIGVQDTRSKREYDLARVSRIRYKIDYVESAQKFEATLQAWLALDAQAGCRRDAVRVD